MIDKKSYEFEIENINLEKLDEIKNILETYKILNIDNSFNKIIIEYNEDPKIEINKEFDFTIKMLRNKYYHILYNNIKLFNEEINSINSNIYNINDSIDYINNDIYDFRGAIEEYENCKQEYEDAKSKLENSTIELPELDDFEYDECDIETLEEISLTNNTDEFKKAVINYIGLYNFDNIFDITDEQMKLYDHIKYDQEYSHWYYIDPLGCYCKKGFIPDRILPDNIDTSFFGEISKCNKYIVISSERIRNFCIKNFEEFKNDIDDSVLLNDILYYKVLFHEIGHAVFSYKHDSENEKRANYFASLTFDGTIDNVIKNMTDLQSSEYKNPILITEAGDKDILDLY